MTIAPPSPAAIIRLGREFGDEVDAGEVDVEWCASTRIVGSTIVAAPASLARRRVDHGIEPAELGDGAGYRRLDLARLRHIAFGASARRRNARISSATESMRSIRRRLGRQHLGVIARACETTTSRSSCARRTASARPYAAVPGRPGPTNATIPFKLCPRVILLSFAYRHSRLGRCRTC